MPYKSNLINHIKTIHACLPQFRAEATINFNNFGLEVRARNKYYRFVPQYQLRRNGQLTYAPVLDMNVRGFIGWLPYFNKRWDAGSDKINFKEFCATHKLRTPQLWRDSAQHLKNVLIKSRGSSFSQGIRGPFNEINLSDANHLLKENEYYEEFIFGRVAKGWYWDGKLICLEVSEMPNVTGNGSATLKELIDLQRNHAHAPPNWDVVNVFTTFQGFSLDSIVPNGKKVASDFKYGSLLYPLILDNANVMNEYRGSQIEEQLNEAGRLCWESIPADIRPLTAFSIDAIIDNDDKVWLLEANCNPMLHPDIYIAIFEGLFGPAETVAPVMPTSTSPIDAIRNQLLTA